MGEPRTPLWPSPPGVEQLRGRAIARSAGIAGEGELALLAPFREQLPKRLFTEVFEFPQSTGTGRNRAPLERSRALLAESGWRTKDGVLVNTAGEPFEIEFLSVDGADQRTVLPYLGALKPLGIAGRIRLVEAAQFVHLRQEFDYDAIITQNDILAPPIVFLSNFFHSQSASEGQSFNASGIADPRGRRVDRRGGQGDYPGGNGDRVPCPR